AAIGDPALLAERRQLGRAPDAELRLERSRCVVDAGVHDAARTTRLVLRDLALLLEDDDSPVRHPPSERARGGETENAASDDGDRQGRTCHITTWRQRSALCRSFQKRD